GRCRASCCFLACHISPPVGVPRGAAFPPTTLFRDNLAQLARPNSGRYSAGAWAPRRARDQRHRRVAVEHALVALTVAAAGGELTTTAKTLARRRGNGAPRDHA